MKYEDTLEIAEPATIAVAQGGDKAPVKRRYYARIAREPFFHFIFLGAILFGIGKYVEDRKNAKQKEIVITKDKVIKLIENYQKVYGNTPTKIEVQALINNAIKEEVLYREGVIQGLDQDDEIIRRRIVQKIQFLQEDLVDIAEPTDQQLQDYVNKNKAKYSTPTRLSFNHIYFSPDNGGDGQANERARKVLASLDKKGIENTSQLGDRFSFLYNYSGVSKNDIAQILGVSPVSDIIFSLPQNKWVGPYKSGYGWHLVYVSGKEGAEIPPLSKIRDQVRDEFIRQQHDQKNAEELDKLKAKYTIIQDDIFNDAK